MNEAVVVKRGGVRVVFLAVTESYRYSALYEPGCLLFEREHLEFCLAP